jgi:hypothetical protein
VDALLAVDIADVGWVVDVRGGGARLVASPLSFLMLVVFPLGGDGGGHG